VVDEAAAAVELDGGIAVADFKVQEPSVMRTGDCFGQVEELGSNSLPPVRGFNEEFVDPGTFAAILEAIVKADDEVPDGMAGIPNQMNEASGGVLKKLHQVGPDGIFVERLRPGVGILHLSHQNKERVEVGESCWFET